MQKLLTSLLFIIFTTKDTIQAMNKNIKKVGYQKEQQIHPEINITIIDPKKNIVTTDCMPGFQASDTNNIFQPDEKISDIQNNSFLTHSDELSKETIKRTITNQGYQSVQQFSQKKSCRYPMRYRTKNLQSDKYEKVSYNNYCYDGGYAHPHTNTPY